MIWVLQWIFKVLAGSAYIGSLTIRSLTIRSLSIASLTISVLSLARQLVILKFNSFKDDDFKSKIGEIATKTSHQVSNQKIREKKILFSITIICTYQQWVNYVGQSIPLQYLLVPGSTKCFCFQGKVRISSSSKKEEQVINKKIIMIFFLYWYAY